MRVIRVIGVGSPFGDDRVGWHVIDQLKSHALKGIEWIACDRPGLKLVEKIRGANCVYIIDAIRSKATVGKIHRLSPQKLKNLSPSTSSHEAGVAFALSLSEAMNELPEQVFLYGIEITETGLGKNISAKVMKAADALIAELLLKLMV